MCASDVFFFNDTATTEIYTLSLHDALPICWRAILTRARQHGSFLAVDEDKYPRDLEQFARYHDAIQHDISSRDRKSTRLNSSHANISYAVFCLKKKKNTSKITYITTIINRS